MAFMMLVLVVIMMAELCDKHCGEEHEDKRLKERDEEFQEVDGDCGDD